MSKEEYRRLFLRKRHQCTKEDVEKYSKDIAKLFFSYFDTSQFKNIHIFLPIPSKKEVNTWYIIDQIRKDYPLVQISVPVLTPQGLESVVIDRETTFVQNSYGILEPADLDKVMDPDVIDLVFVPLLAYDVAGNRIGYGKGYYDGYLRTLKKNCLKVGVSFFLPTEELIPKDEWDMSLDYCINPKKLYTFGNNI